MSFQVTTAFVQEFSANVYMAAQQKGSRLRPFVKMETIKGDSKRLDGIGVTEAVRRTGRHQNTPQVDTPHDARWIFLNDYEWADLVDDSDKIRMLNDPTSEYQMAAMWAMGRAMDDEILVAADATVMVGNKASDGTIDLPNAQKVMASDGTNQTRLNLDTLRRIKSRFGRNDIDDSLALHVALSQEDLDNLLDDPEVTSADYNTVRALVKGEIDSYYGFRFHRLERLKVQSAAIYGNPTTGAVQNSSGGGFSADLTNSKKVVAWAQDGLILGLGSDTKARITERDDKSYSTQVFVSMSIGAVRRDEKKVVIAYVKPDTII